MTNLGNQRATRGPGAPPLVGGGGPRRGGGSSERQREYGGVKLRPYPIHNLLNKRGEPKKKKKKLRLISLRYNYVLAL